MGTYAVSTDLANYIEGFTLTDAAAAERAIVRAEKVIDRLMDHSAGLPDALTGRWIVPADLEGWVADALRDATCAQVEYMWALELADPNANVLAKRAAAGQPVAPDVGPKVWLELQGTGLVSRTARVAGQNVDPEELLWRPTTW